MPLIDSGISLYVRTAQRFLALVVTRKAFDESEALDFTWDFFVMTRSTPGSEDVATPRRRLVARIV